MGENRDNIMLKFVLQQEEIRWEEEEPGEPAKQGEAVQEGAEAVE